MAVWGRTTGYSGKLAAWRLCDGAKYYFMKIRTLLMVGSLFMAPVLLFSCSNDDDNGTPALSTRDRTFMTAASHGNWAEVEMGKLADSISVNDSVNVFAQMMVADHSTAQAELESISNNWAFSLPDTPDSLHLAQQMMLAALSGLAFDTAYINGQIADHAKTITLFEMAVDSSTSPSVRAYAVKYLPKIRMHYDHVQRLKLQVR